MPFRQCDCQALLHGRTRSSVLVLPGSRRMGHGSCGRESLSLSALVHSWLS